MMADSIYTHANIRSITRGDGISRMMRDAIFQERVDSNAADDVVGLYAAMSDRCDMLEMLCASDRTASVKRKKKYDVMHAMILEMNDRHNKIVPRVAYDSSGI